MTETTIISEDGVEPVTLDEAKQQCYIPTDDDDSDIEDLLTRMITAARKYGENRTWVSLVDKTYETTLDEFPCGIIELPKPPLISVESIKYDTSDGEQTLSEDDYRITGKMLGRIEPVNSWPSTKDKLGAVRIQFKAGFEDEEGDPGTSNVPEDLKHAILMKVKAFYDNRDAFVIVERSGSGAVEIPSGSDFIFDMNSERSFG